MALIAELPSLEYVEINDWAGLGAVRYVPQQWQSSGQQLATDQAKQDLNRLNVRIVQQLRSIDAAFSLGKYTNEKMSFWINKFSFVFR